MAMMIGRETIIFKPKIVNKQFFSETEPNNVTQNKIGQNNTNMETV
jgi:hypothetical protein